MANQPQSAALLSTDVFPRPFGKYRLLAPLAQGGMGSLFLACQGQEGFEKLCVVKTVLPLLADKEYVARFRDEAKVVVQLSHGNLVPVFDAGMATGELYIAMDFVDGKDLRAVWNRCAKKGIAFPVDVAVHIAREVARGLYHAHTAGDLQLVHRDVSPPNVLCAFSGEIKLTDFGLASSTIKLEKTQPGVVYGKVSYMAPEQARGEKVDARTDQYAVGIILWELLTGRQLFPAGAQDVLDKVRNPVIDAPSKRASRVPPRLDQIVLRALARDPADRYADCEQLRVALAEFLAKQAPATDSARVAAFLRELFEGEIEDERRKRVDLVEKSRLPRQPVAPEIKRRLRAAADAAGEAPSEELAIGTSSDVVGTVLGGRYKVLRLVGEGGMGRVYEGEHVEIGKRVAIKLLHPAYSRAPELVERFRREARAASRIGHPNIVDVTDCGTTTWGAVYFVMEYLEGIDLAHLIRDCSTLPVARSIAVTVQLARALEAAHAAQIVHRDLKPENVFLVNRPGQTDFVKVLDFGIAQQMDFAGIREGRLTDPGVTVGTPEYMAPEQAAGQKIDARADIYSVGAILYEMLAGHPPHEGKTLMEVLAKKAAVKPAPLVALRDDVTQELWTVVNRALARDPRDRWQTMAELATALERCRPDRRARRGDGPTRQPQPTTADHTYVEITGTTTKPSVRPLSWLAFVPGRWRVAALAGGAVLLALVSFAAFRALHGDETAAPPTTTAPRASAPRTTAPTVIHAPRVQARTGH